MMPRRKEDIAESPELAGKIGAITRLLLDDLPQDHPMREQTLLERALRYAAETEQRMADQMSHISQLENLSYTDPVTGLLNRRGLGEHLGHVLGRARR